MIITQLSSNNDARWDNNTKILCYNYCPIGRVAADLIQAALCLPRRQRATTGGESSGRWGMAGPTAMQRGQSVANLIELR